jgi:uroporphyrin-III C-methyltransferase
MTTTNTPLAHHEPRVWLVGAGPGDPELLTLKAVRILSMADIVLVDDLVDNRILAYCPNARLVRVGKRGGCRSTPQLFIQRLMLRYARQGHYVVRLKGGDPCVFGRAGEETQWLAQYGVACGMVNGITAGLAAATSCGIPLTMRGMSHGVTLVTGHTENSHAPNWHALAKSGTTLVIYMGVATMSHTRQAMIDGGMDPATPVAMIERASLPQQRQCLSTVAMMCDDAATFALRSPAILVVGEVATMADSTMALFHQTSHEQYAHA